MRNVVRRCAVSLSATPGWIFIGPALALAIRATYVTSLPEALTFDEPYYHDVVRNLLSGRGFTFSGSAYHTSIPYQPTSFQEPLYPFFLAATYWVAGQESHLLARLLQAVLATASVALMVVVVRDLWGLGVAALTGLLAAVYPSLVYFTGLLMTETLFVFCLTLTIWLWARAVQTDRSAWYIGSGIAFSLASLTRGMLLWFLPVLLAVTFYTAVRRRASAVTLLLVGVLLCLTPWTLRNYTIHQTLVPITTKAGYNLYFYTYPSANTSFNDRYDIIPIPDMTGLTEAQRDAKFRELALDNIKNNPDLMVRYAWIKLIDFWDARLEKGPALLTLINVLALYSTTALAVLASVRAVRRRSISAVHLLLWSLILFHTLAAIVFTGGGKARLIIEPALIVLAADGVSTLWRRIGGGTRQCACDWPNTNAA